MDGQTEEKKIEYRLYAAPTTAEATEETEKQRFSRMTADYTLIPFGLHYFMKLDTL